MLVLVLLVANSTMNDVVNTLYLQSNLNVISIIIALGSNINHERAFATAIAELGKLGEVRLSSLTVGEDFTGRTTLIYHNACALISLYQASDFETLVARLKDIEKRCGRVSGSQDVPMDLDILAVFDGTMWQISQKRLPFKAHERVGLSEVADFLL